MPTVNIDRSQVAGVIADLKEMWRQTIPIFKEVQERILHFLKPTTIRQAQWAWKESVPFVQYWPYGKGRTYQLFRDRYMTLGKYNYELSIPWSRFDEEDDQLGDMRPHVQMAVQRFGQLPDVLISEYFNGTASLNPAILNAYDGVALFAATDGDGAARFGVTGGNIVTGSGLTVAGVLHDIAVAQQRMLAFQDPAGKLIFSPDDVAFKNLYILGPKEANEVFTKAAQAEMIRSDMTSVTAETNYLKGTFLFDLFSYLTDTSDYYVFVNHPFWKPFAYRAPDAVESVIADMNNSDRARDTGEYCIFTHVRTSMGPWAPFCAVKINN